MGKHILDHERRRKSSRVVSFTNVERRYGPEGTNPAVKALMRRSKGPWNPALRAQAFLRIEAGKTT